MSWEFDSLFLQKGMKFKNRGQNVFVSIPDLGPILQYMAKLLEYLSNITINSQPHVLQDQKDTIILSQNSQYPIFSFQETIFNKIDKSPPEVLNLSIRPSQTPHKQLKLRY